MMSPSTPHGSLRLATAYRSTSAIAARIGPPLTGSRGSPTRCWIAAVATSHAADSVIGCDRQRDDNDYGNHDGADEEAAHGGSARRVERPL